jgi:hypothetical protein
LGRRWSAVGGGSSRYVNAPWIRTGSLPSGYPAATENKLSSLLETHALTEKMAFAELEGFVTPIASDLSPVSRPSRAVSPKRHQFDAMPEISGKQIYRALTGRGLDAVPQEFAWSFPKGYLADALACHPAAAVVVALGKPARAFRLPNALSPTRARGCRFPDSLLFSWIPTAGRRSGPSTSGTDHPRFRGDGSSSEGPAERCSVSTTSRQSRVINGFGGRRTASRQFAAHCDRRSGESGISDEIASGFSV